MVGGGGGGGVRGIGVASVGNPCHFGADPDRADPNLWLFDKDPTPDPTPFYSDFKDGENYYYYFIFL